VETRINIARRLKEAAMTQNNSKSSALTVKTAVRAGAFSTGRLEQPDPANRKQRKTRNRRLSLAQFGVNEHGLPTFTKA
jgi:hypothetical protein